MCLQGLPKKKNKTPKPVSLNNCKLPSPLSES